MSENGTSEFDGVEGAPDGGAADASQVEQSAHDDYQGSQQAEGAVVAQETPEVSAPVEPAPAPAPEAKPKRRKIDLKARLSSVKGVGSLPSTTDRGSDPLSFPPPPATGSVPAPKLPGVSAPMVSSPFAAPEVEKKPTAVQQTIKVEMGEDVMRARKKTQKKYSIYIAIVGLAAIAIGFLLGMTRERGRAGQQAIAGASALAADVDQSNKTMSTLSDALRNASEQLGTDEFPEKLTEVLKTTNVDFSASNFQGRSIGGLPSEVFNRLLGYTNDVDRLNKQKDTLRNLLSAAKPQVLRFFADKEKPKVKFAVMFGTQKKKLVAELVPIKEPFEVKGDWPAKFTVLQRAKKGTKDVKVSMYDGKGKPTGGEAKNALVVEPKSISGFTDLTLIFKLRVALTDTAALIDGRESPDPNQQTDGLLKNGKRIIEGLKKVSQAGG